MKSMVIFVLVLSSLSLYLDVKKDCGAKGDGKTSDTNAIRECFKKCKPGCTMFFPDGDYRCSNFNITSNLRWELESNNTKIFFFNGYDSWHIINGQYAPLIGSYGVKNFSLNGNGGLIDGNGERWWNAWLEGKLKASRPFLFNIYQSSDIKIEETKFQNSPKFHIKIYHSSDIEISKIHIFAPYFKKSRNTDGIDPSVSSNIYIHDSFISTGDDNIAVKGGSSNILVENCVLGTGHGTSLGSLTRDEIIENVVFKDLTFSGTTNGMRIKSWDNWTGYVRNITWKNIKMKNVENTIVFDMNYHSIKKIGKKYHKNVIKGIDGVVFNEIKSEGSGVAGVFNCRNDLPCKNIVMKDVDVSSKKGFECKNAFGKTEKVHPHPCLK